MRPELRVLLQLRLRGRATADTLDTGVLEDLARRGLVIERTGRSGGWTLTGNGRAELSRGLAAELDELESRAEVAAAYRDFLAVNGDFLELCTSWQLRPTPTGRDLNDHTDVAYDAEVLGRLDALHPTVLGICGRLSGALDRFAGYGPRFERALARVHEARLEWFDSPRVDSYHSIWFELHENLLATLGRERSTEPR